MKRFVLFFVISLIVVGVRSQIVTNLNNSPATSTCGKYQWAVKRVEVYTDHTLIQFEITALRPIRRLNIYDNGGHLIYGRENEGEGLGLKGDYADGKINYLGYNSTWGWSNVGAKEKRYYTLYFGGGDGKGNTIPSGATIISVYGIGVEADGEKNTWKSTNICINNPRKNYTNYSSEYLIKQHLDANNDGICGIYEVMGDNAGSKFACVKYNGEYALIFMSDNLGRNWWKMGDIKAYLHQSASGILKADWFMSDKSLHKDCYVGFDGVSMTVFSPSLSDEKEREKKYLKMYPTTPPSYNDYQQEYIPQRRQQSPQTKQIPVLKKQKVK